MILVLGSAAVLTLAAAVLLIKPLVRRYAEREAKNYGVDLTLGDVELGIGGCRFSNAHFSLMGVHSIAGAIGEIAVTLDGLSPSRVQMSRLEVEVVGSFATLGVEVAAFSKDHPQLYRLPASAQAIHLLWRSKAYEPPWLEVQGGSITAVRGGESFAAEHATVAGIDAGKVGAAWTAEQSWVALGLGASSLAEARVVIKVEHALKNPTCDIDLAPTALDSLSDALGVKLPVHDVTASGRVSLVFPETGAAGAVTGRAALKLDGFVPPHPPELDGFVFGNVTTFETRLEIDPEYTRAKLSESRVTAGAFRLDGSGSVAREADHARALLTLHGNLPCGALAGAALETRLGKIVGPLFARGAREFLAGFVGVTVKIDADSRDFEHARIERGIGIGCGLRPLKLPPELGNIPKLEIPGLPSALPPLPTNIPLPDLRLPAREEP